MDNVWIDFKKGDKKAFEKLYSFYREDMCRFGYKLCKNKELVKDCIQEMFLYIYEYKTSISTPRNIKAYLFNCLRNLIHKKLREEKKTWLGLDKIISTLLIMDCCEKKQIHLEQEKEKKENLKILLATLTSKQHEIIHLRFFTGATYKEISESLYITEGSVKKQVYRILKKIRN